MNLFHHKPRICFHLRRFKKWSSHRFVVLIWAFYDYSGETWVDPNCETIRNIHKNDISFTLNLPIVVNGSFLPTWTTCPNRQSASRVLVSTPRKNLRRGRLRQRVEVHRWGVFAHPQHVEVDHGFEVREGRPLACLVRRFVLLLNATTWVVAQELSIIQQNDQLLLYR